MKQKYTTPKRSRLLVVGTGPHALCSAIDVLSRGWLDVILLKNSEQTPEDRLSLLEGGFRHQTNLLHVGKSKQLMNEAFLLSKLIPDAIFPIELKIESSEKGWFTKIKNYWHVKAYQTQQRKFADKHHLNIETRKEGHITELCCFEQKLEKYLENVITKLGGRIVEAEKIESIAENEDGIIVSYTGMSGQSSTQSALYCVATLDGSFEDLPDRIREKFYFNYSSQQNLGLTHHTKVLKKSIFKRDSQNSRVTRIQYNKSVTLTGFSPKNKSDYAEKSVKDYYLKNAFADDYASRLSSIKTFHVFKEFKWLSRDENKDIEQFYLYRDKTDFYSTKRGGLITICPNQLSTFRMTASSVGDTILSDFGEELESKTSQRVFWSFRDV